MEVRELRMVVLCKDCRYRAKKPEGNYSGFDLEWPDDNWECPYRIDDEYYSRYPRDEWFCHRGKLKGGSNEQTV